jgi:peptidoglycan L-alanyl-D-glutamate endopeptidase CwlK
LGAWIDGEVRWDWPLYYKIADAMKKAAHELDVPLEWGGDWKSFKDGPHFQLPWKDYPV